MRFPEQDSRQLHTMVIGGTCVLVPLALGSLLGAAFTVFVMTGAALAGAYAISVLGAGEGADVASSSPRETSPDGLLLQSCTEHFIAREFAAAQRGRHLTLVMFGFSGFEEFSRREGAAAAAEAIRSFGRVLQQMTRQMNLSARYGWRADAFLSVLSEADTQGANVFIRRVRAAAAQLTIPMPGIEAGVAAYDAGIHAPDQLVRMAEEALAAARSTGQRLPPKRAEGERMPAGRVQAA